MLSPRVCFGALYVLAAVLASGGSPSEEWKVFQSATQHFSVRYPASWNLLKNYAGPPETDILEIINFPNSERAEGVVLRKGGASIDVSAVPAEGDSVSDWIHKYGQDDVVLNQREVPLSRPTPGGCLKLSRVVARSEIGPGAYFIYTEYYCRTASGLFSVLLTNWEGDPQQSELQQTALKMALNLKAQ